MCPDGRTDGHTAKNNFLRQISSADLVRFIYDECAI